MATQDTAHSKSKTATDTVTANRLFHIAGTTGRITAAALHPGHDFQGRKDHAVNADQEDQNRLHEPPSMAHFPKKATCYRKNQCQAGSNEF
jgi:hypothetical protein